MGAVYKNARRDVPKLAASMFSTLGLLQSLPCPRRSGCTFCPFSHSAVLATTSIATPSDPPSTVPAKRPIELTTPAPEEPPPQRLRTTKSVALPASSRASVRAGIPRPATLPSTSQTGAPTLRINAAQSLVALPVRQVCDRRAPCQILHSPSHRPCSGASMITLSSCTKNSCLRIRPSLPNMPSAKRSRFTKSRQNSPIAMYAYPSFLFLSHPCPQAVINSIASLKKRVIPTSISHPSVGTDEDIAARAEARNKLDALRLTRSVLTHLVMSTDTMQQWGYVTEIPDGEAGSRPHAVGQITKCERCDQRYIVTNSPTQDQCTYHWGRPFSKTINGASETRTVVLCVRPYLQGEKLRVYSCCLKSTSEDGCSRGFHVFYESDPKDLHLRHPFSRTRPPKSRDGDNSAGTAFDVVALDCEMVYTTGGMRVARVSVVDGSGTEIFDELVRMDDGVEVMSVHYSAMRPFSPDFFAVTTTPDFRASKGRTIKRRR